VMGQLLYAQMKHLFFSCFLFFRPGERLKVLVFFHAEIEICSPEHPKYEGDNSGCCRLQVNIAVYTKSEYKNTEADAGFSIVKFCSGRTAASCLIDFKINEHYERPDDQNGKNYHVTAPFMKYIPFIIVAEGKKRRNRRKMEE
jgi:hypothetical protein